MDAKLKIDDLKARYMAARTDAEREVVFDLIRADSRVNKWFGGGSSFTNTFCNRNSCRCCLFPVITNLVCFACFQLV